MTVTAIRPDVATPDALPSHYVNIWTDMPAGLTDREFAAYQRGYSRGQGTYIRKHGGAGVSGDDVQTITREELKRRSLDLEVAMQPTAHRAGMAELRKWLKKYATEERTAVVLAKPAKPATRKPAAKPETVAPVVAVAPESTPVETVAETVTRAPMTYAARKQSRRELAVAMRAQGIDPRGGAWENAKREAGIA